MPLLLVLLFVSVPLLEILVILRVGAALGGWWTFALLVAASLVGAWLLRVEGRRAWSQFRTALGDGRWPGDEVAQGALVIVGGTLLVTPGFLTDALGFALLLGPSRRMLARMLRARMAAAADGGSGFSVGFGTSGGRAPGGGRAGADRSLDVEVVEITREPLPPAGTDDDARDTDRGPDAGPSGIPPS